MLGPLMWPVPLYPESVLSPGGLLPENIYLDEVLRLEGRLSSQTWREA